MRELNLLIIHLRGGVQWDIPQDAPGTLALRFVPGWSFVNPLVCFRFDEAFKTEHGLSNPDVHTILDDRAIVSTSYSLFLVPSHVVPRKGKRAREIGEGDRVFDALEEISRFLTNARYESKQFSLRTGISSFVRLSFAKLPELPSPSFPAVLPESSVFIRKYIVDTAINWEHLRAASAASPDFAPPVYDTILLDAVHALADGDYRRAILYSAMAVEIIAAAKLDDAYRAVIQRGSLEPHLRIISIPQAGGREAVKDPVYECLSGRTDFAQLLHERSLYLLKKSLLVENQKLYKAACKLYATRNKIVHRGEPPDEQDAPFFTMNQPDAQTAVGCAIEVFRWFGEPGEYTIPDVEFYGGHKAEENWCKETAG